MFLCSACQVYFVFCFLFLHSFLFFFFPRLFRRCSALMLYTCVSLVTFFYPLCCVFRFHDLFHCLFLVPLMSGLMLDWVCCDSSGHTCVCLGWTNWAWFQARHTSGFGFTAVYVWQWPLCSQWSVKDQAAAVEWKMLKCSIHQNRTFLLFFFITLNLPSVPAVKEKQTLSD